MKMKKENNFTKGFFKKYTELKPGKSLKLVNRVMRLRITYKKQT